MNNNKISIGKVSVNTFFGPVDVLSLWFLLFHLLYLVHALFRWNCLFFFVFEKLVCFNLALVPVIHVVEYVSFSYEEFSE